MSSSGKELSERFFQDHAACLYQKLETFSNWFPSDHHSCWRHPSTHPQLHGQSLQSDSQRSSPLAWLLSILGWFPSKKSGIFWRSSGDHTSQMHFGFRCCYFGVKYSHLALPCNTSVAVLKFKIFAMPTCSHSILQLFLWQKRPPVPIDHWALSDAVYHWASNQISHHHILNFDRKSQMFPRSLPMFFHFFARVFQFFSGLPP